MRRALLLITLFLAMNANAWHRVESPNIKSLQVVVNDDWLSLPVMMQGSDDVLTIAFDELSHNYHRFIVHLEHCNPDWTPSEGLFDSDWIDGFNDWPIEDYANSINTTVLYTHYQTQLPNEHCKLKMSGNYRVHVLDESNDNQEVLTAEFRVVEPILNIGLNVTTNTDIDSHQSHQQVNMTILFNSLRVTNCEAQLQTFVLQNGREDNMKANIAPNLINQKGLQWEHNKKLIFEAGNEYHKFETLDPSHTTMGLEHIEWDESDNHFHAYPFACEPRRNYIYDEDANGAFCIRNSEDTEPDLTCDYLYIHYQLKALRKYDFCHVVVDGQWATDHRKNYFMHYDESDHSYHATILQKQGYYNYHFLMLDLDGVTHRMPEEGSYYQTENRYQAFAYYKGVGERAWRLVGYQQIVSKASLRR